MTDQLPAPESPYSPITEEVADGNLTAWQPPPRLWTVWLAFAIACIAMLLLGILAALPFVVPMILQNPGQPPDQAQLMAKLTSPFVVLVTSFPPQLGIMLTAVFAAYLSPIQWKERLGFTRSSLSRIETLVVGVGSFVPATIGMLLATGLSALVQPDNSAVKIWEGMTPALVVPWVLFIAFMPGFGEEMLFRGYMQRRLLQRVPPAVSIIATSILFAVIHLLPHTVIFAFPIGLWLGYVAWKTDSIWPTVTAHILINGVWNIIQTSRSMLKLSDGVYNLIIGVTVAVGFVAFIWSLKLIHGVGVDAASGSVEEGLNS